MDGSYGALLRTYLAPYWRRALLLLLLLLLGAGLTLLSPRILGLFIDAVFGGVAENTLELGGLFLALAVANQAITIATNYLGTDMGLRATNRLRADLALHTLYLDLAFHNATSPGSLIERIDGDVSRLNQFLSNFAVLLLKNALLIAGALVAVALIDWRAGVAISLFVVIGLVALEVTRRIALPRVRHERETSASLFGTLEERLAGIEDMRANGGVAYVMRRFTEQSRPWAKAFRIAHATGATSWQVANVSYALGLVLTLGVAAWLVGTRAITIGNAYALYRYVELMRTPITQIGRQVQDLQQAGAALARLSELLAVRSEIRDTGTALLPASALTVTFQDVSFTYPDAREPTAVDAATTGGLTVGHTALNAVSFHLTAGRVLGLLGRTGSGKTTITRLLLRFYEPERGLINLNQQALGEIAIHSLRERVALVTQEVQVFNASVRDNLSLFDPSIPDERMHTAITAVELDDWFRTLPHGLDTLMPPGGGMSAGQAQLLAVARVLLKDPGLVILDEASSRLDPATEGRLEQALQRLLQGRTAIIIAHRLQTVQRADDILIMEGGQCVEWGERAALVKDPASRFAQLTQVGMEEALA